MAKKDKETENVSPKSEKKQTGEASVTEEKKPSFFKSTAFILIAAIVAFIGMVVIILSAAFKGGFTLKSLFGGENEQLDYREDPLSEYIDIKDRCCINCPIAPAVAQRRNFYRFCGTAQITNSGI